MHDAPMPARLYVVPGSHPCAAIEKALELKGIDYRAVELPPPTHTVLMRRLFGARTVPGIRFADGEKVQGSRAIVRALERRVPDPPLLAGPDVEEAERWGEETLQAVPRRLFRWGAARHRWLRRWIVSEVVGMPAPGVMAWANAPVARKLASMVDARDDAIRGDLEALPDLLAHADSLIAAGTIGGESPNAADFQIATSVRVLLAFQDTRPLVAGRPIDELATRILPDYPDPIPRFLPPAWL